MSKTYVRDAFTVSKHSMVLYVTPAWLSKIESILRTTRITMHLVGDDTVRVISGQSHDTSRELSRKMHLDFNGIDHVMGWQWLDTSPNLPAIWSLLRNRRFDKRPADFYFTPGKNYVEFKLPPVRSSEAERLRREQEADAEASLIENSSAVAAAPPAAEILPTKIDRLVALFREANEILAEDLSVQPKLIGQILSLERV